MHDETVETYTNIYARWFAIISQFIVTASLCTLLRLQMTRYSQVLVHSTVVNSRLSHQYMPISLIFLSCFGIYSDFSYFLPGLCLLLESSPNLCVNSSFSYVVLSTLLLSSGDLTEWSLVYHNTLSYQRFYDLHSIHYDHLEGLHQLI